MSYAPPESEQGEPSAAPPRPPSRLHSWGRTLPLTTIVLAILLTVALIPYIVRRVSEEAELGRARARATVARENLEDINLKDLSYRFRQLATAVAPSVVHINTVTKQAATDDDGRGVFLHPQAGPKRRGQGSGVIMDSEGYILTNQHVIRGAEEIIVTLANHKVLEAQLIGEDVRTDLAVLKISGDGLQELQWESDDSTAFDAGSLVWAVGSPFGLEHSITMGIISARGRRYLSEDGRYDPQKDYLQHDAAVNPGNSGGPLISPEGKVVGINTLIFSKSGGFQGVSFAIPSEIARDVYQRLKTDRKYTRGLVGVSLSDVTDDLVEQLQLPAAEGALVREVFADSPAAVAGAKEADVFVKWNGKNVPDLFSFSRMVSRTKPGSKVDAVVIRDGKQLTLSIIVGERPEGL
jgi:serine protease Do